MTITDKDDIQLKAQMPFQSKKLCCSKNISLSLRCAEYMPGTPGGAWSAAELLAVRAKLWLLYSNNYVYKLRKKFGKFGLPTPSKEADLGFFAAKVLRLRQ